MTRTDLTVVLAKQLSQEFFSCPPGAGSSSFEEALLLRANC